jgi:hypothetical protein
MCRWSFPTRPHNRDTLPPPAAVRGSDRRENVLFSLAFSLFYEFLLSPSYSCDIVQPVVRFYTL